MITKGKAVYPGSFDPVTLGHIDLIERAGKIFDEVIVAIAHNREKTALFSVEDRKEMLIEATCHIPNVRVDDFHGLIVKYVVEQGAGVIIRGLRMISDFEYEFQMGLTNRKLDSRIETVFLMPQEKYSYISSKLIKEAASMGAALSGLVPSGVEDRLKARFFSS